MDATASAPILAGLCSTKHFTLIPLWRRRALTADREQAEATALERRLGWYAAGQHIALDVARGLHFLHKSGVRCPCTP